MAYFKKFLTLFVVIALAAFIVAPIFGQGFFPMHDDTQPTRVYEMAKSLQDGLFPVRWVDDLGFGYGYPIFNFYSPLPYYLGALYFLIGIDALLAAKFMFATAVFIAGVGMYLFARSFLGQIPAVAAAVSYILFPYFAINIFIRAAVGEYYAYAFLPYVFWGLFRIYYEQKNNFPFTWIVVSSVAMTFVIIAHNLSAYMMAVTVGMFIVGALIMHQRRLSLLFRYGIVLLLAALLSAFYIVPVAFEVPYTDVSSQVTGGFKYFYHYICPMQLWDSPWGYGGSVKGCIDGMSFRLGKSNIFFGIAAIVLGFYVLFIKRSKKFSYLFIFSSLLLVFSVFMTTSMSEFFWQMLPGISFLQFPWRFLNYVGFSLALLAGLFIYFLQKVHKVASYVAAFVVIIAAIVFNLKLFVPQTNIERNAGYYTDKQTIAFKISSLTSEYMPRGFLRPTNPNDVPKQLMEVVGASGDVVIVQDTTNTKRARITMVEDGNVLFHKAFFPAWKLWIDAHPQSFHQVPTGMEFALSKGQHEVAFTFQQTPIEQLGNFLTITGVFAVFLGIIIRRKYAKHDKKSI